MKRNSDHEFAANHTDTTENTYGHQLFHLVANSAVKKTNVRSAAVLMDEDEKQLLVQVRPSSGLNLDLCHRADTMASSVNCKNLISIYSSNPPDKALHFIEFI